MTNEFRLSRIYAEGWNAAGALSADESTEHGARECDARNPYKDDQERARWAAGFSGALGNSSTLAFRASGFAPRPASK